MAEETSKRVARENFTISNVQMLQMASFEPLLHQPRDEEEEGEKKKHVFFFFFHFYQRSFFLFVSVHNDDDRFAETSIQIRQAQGTFPSAFGVAVLLLVEMLEDEETIETGATGKNNVKKKTLDELFKCFLLF